MLGDNRGSSYDGGGGSSSGTIIDDRSGSSGGMASAARWYHPKTVYRTRPPSILFDNGWPLFASSHRTWQAGGSRVTALWHRSRRRADAAVPAAAAAAAAAAVDSRDREHRRHQEDRPVTRFRRTTRRPARVFSFGVACDDGLSSNDLELGNGDSRCVAHPSQSNFICFYFVSFVQSSRPTFLFSE